jgi:hypothetical protein
MAMSSPPSDGYHYDVFLSYRQKDPDRAWVRKVLLPRLDAAGLRVFIDVRDFVLGASIVTETERAVLQSRYTLAVLSPAYLTSNFTELESVLSRHLGLENRQRRFLAVLREPCDPGLDIRARLWLDMTDDAEFEERLERLVLELRKPPEM